MRAACPPPPSAARPLSISAVYKKNVRIPERKEGTQVNGESTTEETVRFRGQAADFPGNQTQIRQILPWDCVERIETASLNGGSLPHFFPVISPVYRELSHLKPDRVYTVAGIYGGNKRRHDDLSGQ